MTHGSNFLYTHAVLCEFTPHADFTSAVISRLEIDPPDFQVFSVLSISPVRDPALSDRLYATKADVSAMLERMRIVLRIAASHGHTRLVLAAFGCGRAHHPPELVARLWLKVFREEEFKGGWWEYVVFAVNENGHVFR